MYFFFETEHPFLFQHSCKEWLSGQDYNTVSFRKSREQRQADIEEWVKSSEQPGHWFQRQICNFVHALVFWNNGIQEIQVLESP